VRSRPVDLYRGTERVAGRFESKRLMATAIAFVLMTGSVQAFGDSGDWDCNNSLVVSGWKDQLTVSGIKETNKAVIRLAWGFTWKRPKQRYRLNERGRMKWPGH
jgi:hypothetical protein